MKILLTGFEAFDQSNINPSAEAIKKIAQDPQYASLIMPLDLPVDTITAPGIILEAIEIFNPDAVVCLGEASGRLAISIERVALNLMDFRIPDNTGNVKQDETIVPKGPDAYFSTIPVRKIYENMQAAGIPAELSLSAGAYLCNQILYTVLHKFAGTSKTAGFIHVPSLPQQVVEKKKLFPSMALETTVSAVKIVLDTIKDQS